MGYPRALRLLTLCAVILLAACGSPPPTATLTSATPAPSAPPVETVAPTATSPAIRATVGNTNASLTLPTPATTPVAQATATQRPSPTPMPPSWQEVARWQGDSENITETFNVRGPWRICWSLPGGRELFQLMVGDMRAGTWELLTAQPGATAGRFDEARGGSFQLMFHNSTRYVVVVEDSPPGGLPPSRSILPCAVS